MVRDHGLAYPMVTKYGKLARFLVGTTFLLVGLYHTSKLASELGSEEDPNDFIYSEHWEQKRKEAKGQEEGSDQEKEDESSIFIPLTWASKRPVEPYNDESPEWQSFIELERDKKRTHQLHIELRNIACDAALNLAAIRRKLGNGVVETTYNARIAYPYWLPQEYECSGLASSADGSITWKTDVVDLSRVRRFAVPYATAKAVWAGSCFIARAYYHKIARLLGFTVKDMQQPKQLPASGSLLGSPSPRAAPYAIGVRPPRNPIFAQGALIFGTTYRRAVTVRARPIRGSCRFRGTVILKGQQGGCMLLVNSDYHPAADIWVGHSIQLFDIWPDHKSPPVVQKKRSDANAKTHKPQKGEKPQVAPQTETSPSKEGPTESQPSDTVEKSPSPPPETQPEEAPKKPSSNGPPKGTAADDQ
ncbi:MAG: hypothetical protein Q9160_002007 [Pyrenula sp. 1 TL-2023]